MSMKCINCNNAGKCLDHREIPDLAGCTSGIPDRKAKTNADRIRSMSDEELADFIEMKQFFAIARNGTDGEEYTLNWLQSEVEEQKMFGFISGYSDTSIINYCPACGERIKESFADGTCKCRECGLKFGVVESDEEEE